jgi:plastocyanin
MSDTTLKEVYRIDTGGYDCRSIGTLVTLNLLEIGGVDVVASDRDGELLAVTVSGSDVYDDVVRAVVKSGLHPRTVTISDLERALNPTAFSVEEAERLGLVEPPKVPVRATVQTVQRLHIDVTDGYDPDTVIVSAGVPVEIEFSEGHGCLGTVVFDSLGVSADLENGGAIVKLPALEPGTYAFRCGMDMVHGMLVAEEGEEQ